MSELSVPPAWPSATFFEMPPEPAVSDRLLDLHTFVNFLNVIAGLLSWAGGRTPPPTVQGLMDAIGEATEQFLETDGKSVEALLADAGFRNRLVELSHGWLGEKEAELQSLFLEVLTLFDARLRQFRETKQHPTLRQPVRPDSIEASILRFFRVTSAYSGGRFRLAQTEQERQTGDHLVRFRLAPAADGKFHLPPIALDSLQDLVANARKYSPRGGTISVSVRQTEQEAVLGVQDQGMGIPEEELKRVVQFGYRARNAGSITSMGFGFGLTKALSVAVRHGGHLRIRSGLAEGTAVELFLPAESGA